MKLAPSFVFPTAHTFARAGACALCAAALASAITAGAAHADAPPTKDGAPQLTALQTASPTALRAHAPSLGATRVIDGREARATSFGAAPKTFTLQTALQTPAMQAPARVLAPTPMTLSSRPALSKPAASVRAIKGNGQTSTRARAFNLGADGVRVIEGNAVLAPTMRLARNEDSEITPLPAATLAPRSLPTLEQNGATALLEMGAMSKVIRIDARKVAPASQPLPAGLQSFVVSLDEGLPQAAPAGNARLAQNPMAPPVRQPQHPIESSDRLPNQLEVAASTYVVLITKADLQTVAIADANIADVTVVNARSVLVNGKMAGITTLVIVDRLGKIRQYQVRVVAARGTTAPEIATSIGVEGVSVRRVQDAIVLEGEVATPEDAQRAVAIAGIYATKVVNQLRVRGLKDEGAITAAAIQDAIARPDVQIHVNGKTAILDGVVTSEQEHQRALSLARAYTDNVVDLLRFPNMTVEQLRDLLGAVEAAPSTPVPYGMAGEMPSTPPRLVVRRSADQIILEGTLPSQADVDAALAAAARTGLQIQNRLVVAPAPPAEAAMLNTIAQAIGIPGIRVRGTVKRIVLEGVVNDTNTAIRAGQVALGFAPNVDNMIAVLNPTQVNVDVTIAEISKSNSKDLGLTFGGPSGTLTDITTGVLPPGIQIGNIGIGQGANTTFGTALNATFRAQIANGNVRILSNPRTTVLSGHTASFQVGGQVPIPTNAQIAGSTGVTTVTIEFKDFGVLMDVTPIATNDGAVTMRVRTDITQIDPSFGSGITVAPGITVPAFTRRAAVTEVTTRTGGTIALSGLISNNVTRAVREIPVLSKIPILGALFTSKRFINGESDLVIFVTPRVIENPLAPGQAAPSTPIAVGPSSVAPTIMGNPGIQTFATIGGAGVQPGATGGGASGGGSQ